VKGARPSTEKMVVEYRTVNDDKHKVLIFQHTAQKYSCYSSFAQSTLLYEIVVSVWLSPLMISVRTWKESTKVVAGSAFFVSVRIITTQLQHWKYYYKRNWMSRQIIGLYFLSSANFDILMPKYIQGNWRSNYTVVIQKVYCCFVKQDDRYIYCNLFFYLL
jgi:hypothetical protein